jgi:hypothetical protein
MALTGFIANGNCIDGSAAAINAIAAPFPIVSGSTPSLVSFAGATFTAPNTFDVNMLVQDLTSSNSWNLSHSVILPICDPAIFLAGGNVFDPVLGAAFWSFAMTFVVGVYLLAKNAGVIIDAIKRF